MPDFLLELRCEEIPARMQAGARKHLEEAFLGFVGNYGIVPTEITVWSTPRRLALIARDLPEATEAVSEEIKGPRTSAPAQALEGFLRKTGLGQDQLEDRDGTWFAVIEKPGRATKDVLAEAIPAIIRDFTWPKSQRWGAASISTESLRWVRPLSGIVALLGDDVVECEVHGVKSGRETKGHRFHGIRKADPKSRNLGLPIEFFKDKNPTVLNANGMIEIGRADDYARKLAHAYVIVDHKVREDEIRIGAMAAAKRAGLTLVEDESLVVENAGLTEWPVPLLGRFDGAFLDVPPEVIQLTARVNQKYFVCRKPSPLEGRGLGEGAVLANAFICTANIDAEDPAVVVDGNRKVLAARLSDARFFWEQDQKTPLAEHAKKLSRITFHEKLGTVDDKAKRVAKLARWLCEEGIVKADPDLADQAALLCKADLVTEMVGEFPELQGLMGGYYAAKEGLPQEVSDAIRDHYKPAGQGDEVPTSPVTVAVSLADKLDTLTRFFLIEEAPTGSKDPFALRRAAIAVIALILENGLRFRLEGALLAAVSDDLDEFEQVWHGHTEKKLAGFFADRLKVQQREAGVRHDLIDAVFALGGEDDLVRLLARVHALQAFIGTEDGANLLAGYKRAANILKKEDWHGVEGEISRTGEEDPLAGVDDPDLAPVVAAKMAERHAMELSHTPEPAEKALIDALDAAEPRAIAAIEAEDFAAAMSALASLRGPIDRFFDEVTVNAPQESVRASRLDLLARFRAAVHKVADFSQIEG